MGYRSEIAIAIHKDVIGEFLTFLKTTEIMHEIFGKYGFTLDRDFQSKGHWPVSYTHLTLPTIYSV